MIRKHAVDKHMVERIVGTSAAVEELPESFRLDIDCGKRHFWLRSPKELPLMDPDTFWTPLMKYADFGGTFVQSLGPEYSQCVAFFQLGYDFKPEDIGFPAELAMTCDIEQAHQVVIYLRWPKSQPIPPFDDANALTERLGVLWSSRDNVYEGFGEDVIIFPITRLSPKIHASFADSLRRISDAAEFTWRSYEIEREHWKAKMMEYAKPLREINLKFDFGEDCAYPIMTEAEKAEYGLLMPMFYTPGWAENLRKKSLQMKMRRDLASGALFSALLKTILED